jgi:nucleoid-associated protein YgaU
MGKEKIKALLAASAGREENFRQAKEKMQGIRLFAHEAFCEMRSKRIRRFAREATAKVPFILILSCAVACFFVFFPFAAPSGTYEHIEITVLPGDTVWTISGEFAAAGEDVRAVVDRVYQQNKLDAGKAIQPGQKIVVPALKGSKGEKIAFAGRGAPAP